MQTQDLKEDVVLEVVVGSPHTAEEAKEALRRGLIPIERWTAGDGRDIEGGVRMDGKITGYGRVTDKDGRPVKCSKVLVGREETIIVP